MSDDKRDNSNFDTIEMICRCCSKTYEISSVSIQHKTLCHSCYLEAISLNNKYDLNHNVEEDTSQYSQDRLQAENVLKLIFSKSISHLNHNKKELLNRLENEILLLYKLISNEYERLKDEIDDYFINKGEELEFRFKLAKGKLLSNNERLPIEMYKQNTFLDPFNDVINTHLNFEPNIYMKQFTLNGMMEVINEKNNLKFDKTINSLVCTNNSIILLLKCKGIGHFKYSINEYLLNKDLLINHSTWITGCKISYDIAANMKNIYLLEKESGNLYVVKIKKFTDPEEPKIFAAVSITYNETSFPICCIVPFQKGVIMHRGNGKITKISDPFNEDWTIELNYKYIHSENMMATQNFLFILLSDSILVIYLENGEIFKNINYNESNIMLSYERLNYIIPMNSVSCVLLSTYSIIFLGMNSDGEPEMLRYERREGSWMIRDFILTPFGVKLCLLDDTDTHIKLFSTCLAKY